MPGPDLTFVAPTTVEEAIGELAGGDAMVLAGGTSVALLLKNRLATPERLVYLGRVAELGGIVSDGTAGVRIGTTVTLRELAASPLIAGEYRALAVAAAHVGNPRVRAVATIGGALAHGDPRQDLPPVLMALGARAVIAGPSGRRTLAVSQLYQGFMETVLADDEIITDVLIPRQPGQRAAYVRFTPGSADDYPTVSVAVALTMDSAGIVHGARLALGGVASTTLLADAAAQPLIGQHLSPAAVESVADAAAAMADPPSDQRGSARYRRAMVAVWTRRAIEACQVHLEDNPWTWNR